jgi:hypothetical protein
LACISTFAAGGETVRELHIDANGLGAAGAAALVTVLEQLVHLEVLGAVRVLEKNFTLKAAIGSNSSWLHTRGCYWIQLQLA